MMVDFSKIKKFKEETVVDAHGDLACIGAAMYLAIILYPDDTPKRDDFVNACRAWIIKGITGGQLKRRLVDNTEILKFGERRKIDAQLDRADKIIVEKRLPALHLFKLQLMSKAVSVTISKDEKFTINKWLGKHYPTSEYALKNSGIEYNKGNAYDRIWSPAKSIIHLVAGLENSITDKQKPLSIETLLINPEWLPEAITISENLRKLMISIKAINIKENQQIRISKKLIP